MRLDVVGTLLTAGVQLLAMVVVVIWVNRRVSLGRLSAGERRTTLLVRGTARAAILVAAAIATFALILALRVLTLWVSK